MRLGAQESRILTGTLARRIYGRDAIHERHRHRFEFNNHYLERMQKAGLAFSAFSEDGLVEIIELPSHPWYVAVQFHPEFKSKPLKPHPLFAAFVEASYSHARASASRPAASVVG
jgi:CTP synthase